jgi:Zn ribbon nucleic-acid-binding protein
MIVCKRCGGQESDVKAILLCVDCNYHLQTKAALIEELVKTIRLLISFYAPLNHSCPICEAEAVIIKAEALK